MIDATDDNAGANVIPFPHRLLRPIDAATRLDQAISGLDQANTELREAVQNWRGLMTRLTVSLGQVTQGLRILDTELSTISLTPQHPVRKEPERKA